MDKDIYDWLFDTVGTGIKQIIIVIIVVALLIGIGVGLLL